MRNVGGRRVMIDCWKRSFGMDTTARDKAVTNIAEAHHQVYGAY